MIPYNEEFIYDIVRERYKELIAKYSDVAKDGFTDELLDLTKEIILARALLIRQGKLHETKKEEK